MTEKLGCNEVRGEQYRFTILTDHLIRMEYSATGEFVDNATQAVVNRDFPATKFEVQENQDGLEIITAGLHLYYTDGEFSPDNLFIDVKSNLTDYGNRWVYGDHVETLKGTTQTLDGVDGSTELQEGIISRAGFAVLDDSDSFTILENGELESKKFQSSDLYFFAYQHDYQQALSDFYHLSGQVPILPRFALGNWWSRFWQYSETSYVELLDQFKAVQIPLAVGVLDMDWHIRDIPKRFGSGWTGYSWNKDLFPKPEQFLQQLHQRGLKVTLNVHPAAGIRACEDAYPAISSRLKLNVSLEEPAVFDFNNTDFRKGYFADVHHPLEEQGVDFWWLDWQQGNQSKSQGIPPLWALNHYHFLDSSKRGTGLILSRYAGIGSQRYPIGFSGDSIVSWASLAFQPYFTATASNVGYSWWSHDIGGHMEGVYDEELSLRWLQLGVFSPINRLHSGASSFSGKEPWNYSLPIANGMKTMLQLRHALIPYLYTMSVRNHEKGVPLVQPLYYQHPEADEAYIQKNEYYFGSQLLVAPITTKSNASLKMGSTLVWLPAGQWFDFFTGTPYQGDTTLKVFRAITEIPVFARAGAIVPLDANPLQTKADELPTKLHWKIFAGASNSFTLVETLGEKTVRTQVQLDWKQKTLTVTNDGATEILSVEREHQFEIIGTSLSETLSMKQTGTLSLTDYMLPNTVNIAPQYFDRLRQAEIPYALKETCWAHFQQTNDYAKRINALRQIVTGEQFDWLAELLYVESVNEKEEI
ncbi:MAG: DUF4968 domain-containing protein [Lactobacillaceae bacterium]|jgi:alpha-glucosidase (family GH31 glycosyl hydrolase)|nr:DUF4968 domain-containing protein [Lactobacillaceae bacterium]